MLSSSSSIRHQRACTSFWPASSPSARRTRMAFNSRDVIALKSSSEESLASSPWAMTTISAVRSRWLRQTSAFSTCVEKFSSLKPASCAAARPPSRRYAIRSSMPSSRNSASARSSRLGSGAGTSRTSTPTAPWRRRTPSAMRSASTSAGVRAVVVLTGSPPAGWSPWCGHRRTPWHTRTPRAAPGTPRRCGAGPLR